MDDAARNFFLAAGSVDITPLMKVPLAGYRTLRKPTFDAIADALEANAVVLRVGGEPTVLVSVDLLYVGAYVRDRVFAALAGRVARERIFLAASHTHFAPATEGSLPVIGLVAPEYQEFAATRIVELLDGLLDSPSTPVVCRYHEGAASHSVYRRRTRFGLSRRYPYIGYHTDIRPNEDGPRDDVVRLLMLCDPAGRAAAICWSYACHPVGYPLINSVSAEYPGHVRRRLRQRYGSIPVLFWQGFSGNINPHRYDRGAAAAAADRALEFVAPSIEQWERWSGGLADAVLAAAELTGRQVEAPLVGRRRSIAVRDLGLDSHKDLTYREIAFGRDLVICGLSAEMAVEYVNRLRAIHAPVTVIPVGCIEEVFGYLPVDEMIPQGGYEVSEFVRRFGLRGKFRRNVCAIVENRLLSAATDIPSESQAGAPGRARKRVE